MAYQAMNPYIPVTDFSDDEAQQTGGRSTVDTSGLDAELAALKTLTDAFKSNIDLTLRSDGRITDRFVEAHGLHPDIFKTIAANVNLLNASALALLPVVDTGSADAIVGDLSPAPLSYTNGLVALVLMNATVTGGPVTANLNGIGNTPVKQADGTTDPAVGELQANGYAFLVHDGTVFQHINKTTSSGSISAHLADLANPHVVTMAQVGVSVGDPTDTNAIRDKVFSNNDLKLVNDYRLVGHLPLAGGSISGALTLAGVNTVTGPLTMSNLLTMNAKQFRGAFEASIASASTVDLSTVLGNSCQIIGNATINQFGTVQAGVIMYVEFTGTPTLTDSANLSLPTSGAIAVQAGDTGVLLSKGSGNWTMLVFHRKDGTALVAASGTTPTGGTISYIGVGAPAGWVAARGGTMGNAVSGASERAKADTNALFNLFWNSMADAEAPVSSGRGASAQADFDANKTITLPDMRGRAVVGSGTGATPTALTNRVHGIDGGEEDHVLSVGEIPALPLRLNQELSSSGALKAVAFVHALNAVTNASIINSLDVLDPIGGDGPHNNMQPFTALNWIIKL